MGSQDWQPKRRRPITKLLVTLGLVAVLATLLTVLTAGAKEQPPAKVAALPTGIPTISSILPTNGTVIINPTISTTLPPPTTSTTLPPTFFPTTSTIIKPTIIPTTGGTLVINPTISSTSSTTLPTTTPTTTPTTLPTTGTTLPTTLPVTTSTTVPSGGLGNLIQKVTVKLKRRLAFSRAGRLSLPVSCGVPCAGGAVMAARVQTSKTRSLSFAKGSFNLPKGSGKVRMKLTKAGAKYLRSHRSALTRLAVVAADASKRTVAYQKTVRISRQR